MSDARMLKTPNVLKKRADVPGGKSLADLEKAGAAIIARAANAYPEQLAKDIEDLRTALKRVDGAAAMAAEINTMFRISHDIRGQAGSFDWPLIGVVAKSMSTFCDAVRRKPEVTAAADAISPLLQLHIDTMNLLLTTMAKGQGGDAEAKVIGNLQKATTVIAGRLNIEIKG